MTPLLLALAAAAFVVWAWAHLRRDPVALADRAVSTGKFEPVLDALHRVAPGDQPTEYHRVMKRLWDGYHREEAVPLAKDFARHHRDAPTAQYWLRQYMEKEPEIAKAEFDEAFLAEAYNPAVAAKCGTYG